MTWAVSAGEGSARASPESGPDGSRESCSTGPHRPTRSPRADMALLAMFSGTAQPAEAQEPAYQAGTISAGSSAGLPAEHHAGPVVVLGQALTAPAPQPAAAAFAAGLPPAVPANPVQQLQFQAVMQHRAAIMQNPAAYPVAAQAYQHAMLQQQHLLSAHAATYSGSLGVAPAPAAPLAGKRHKSQEEVEEQTERIKKRRRESAQRRCATAAAAARAPPLKLARESQLNLAHSRHCHSAYCAVRSRQRKSAYMKSLEMENRALKLENERLRWVLAGGWQREVLAAAGGITRNLAAAPLACPAALPTDPRTPRMLATQDGAQQGLWLRHRHGAAPARLQGLVRLRVAPARQRQLCRGGGQRACQRAGGGGGGRGGGGATGAPHAGRRRPAGAHAHR